MSDVSLSLLSLEFCMFWVVALIAFCLAVVLLFSESVVTFPFLVGFSLLVISLSFHVNPIALASLFTFFSFVITLLIGFTFILVVRFLPRNWTMQTQPYIWTKRGRSFENISDWKWMKAAFCRCRLKDNVGSISEWTKMN